MKALQVCLWVAAMLAVNAASAEVISAKLGHNTPLTMQLNKGDVLKVTYSLHHIATRFPWYYALECKTGSSAPVFMDYTYRGGQHQVSLPALLSDYEGKEKRYLIDEKGEFKLSTS